jgi:hypothetical protein
LRLIELLHLFENLRFQRRDLFTGCICFTNCGCVFVLPLRRHQVAFGSFGPSPLFDDLDFQARATVFGFVAAVFQCSNFKGALIELSFDLSAPFGYRFLVFF